MHTTLSHPEQQLTQEIQQELPDEIRQWLMHTVSVDRMGVRDVLMWQSGRMRLSPGGKWMPFKAQQQVDLVNHGFTWTANVRLLPYVHLYGRDELQKGEGRMNIKLFSLLNLVDAGPNPRMNSASLIRYLAEMCWYPSLAVDPAISWNMISDHHAKATLRSLGPTVTGTFEFNEEGDIVAFEALRYRGGDDKAREQLWRTEINSYQTFDHCRVPEHCSVFWGEAEDRFHWLDLTVKQILYC